MKTYLLQRFTLAALAASLSGCFNGSSYLPFVSTVSQAALSADSSLDIGATSLVAAGNFFSPGAVLYWNGKQQSTLYKGPGELDVTLDSGLTDAEGSAQVIVVNGDGTSSNAVTVAIKQLGATVTGFAPTSALPGDGPLTLTVNGIGFLNGAQISWNGGPLATTRVSGHQLTAVVPASLLATAGNATILVTVPCCQTFSNTFNGQLTFTIGSSTSKLVFAKDESQNLFGVSDLVWDATRARLYGAGNGAIWTIDPVLASAVATAAANLGPRLAISAGDQFLYDMQTFIFGDSASRRTLPDFSAQVTLPGVFEVIPAPGSPAVSAVTLNRAGSVDAIAIADGTTLRPRMIPGPFNGDQSAIWGADGSTLYVQSGFAPSQVQRYTVDSSGLSGTPTLVTNAIAGGLFYDRTIRRLYGTSGSNFDEQGNSHGSFVLPLDRFNQTTCGSAVADGAIGKVFFVCSETFGVTVRSYNADTSAFIGTLVVNPPADEPRVKIVRWGTNGLAIAVNSEVVLYSGPFVQ